MNLTQRTRILFAIFAIAVVGFWFYYSNGRRESAAPSLADQSIQQLQEMVNDQPNNPNLRVSLAQAYLERKRYDDGIAQFQQALKLQPKNENALLGLSKAYLGKQDDADAAPFLKQIVDMNAGNPDSLADERLEFVYLSLAQLEGRAGDWATVEGNLKEALKIDSTDSAAWYLLGEAQRRQGRESDSLDSYRRAVSSDPHNAEAYQAMAGVFADMRQPAMVDYATGMIALIQNDNKTAASLLKSATAISATNADAFRGLGQAYESLNRPYEAVAAYQTAVKLDPTNVLAVDLLQRAQERLNQSAGMK